MRKALYILGELDDTDVEWLAEHGSREHISQGTVLIHKGEPVSQLFVVLEGRLAVSAADGNEIASLLSGEVVGEISFVDSRPPSASVSASEDTHVLSVSCDLLRTKIEKDPHFAARFYRALAVFLADRLRVTTGRFGYGSGVEDAEAVDELSEDQINAIDLAGVRFDRMIKRLSGA